MGLPKVATVDDYLQGLPADRRAALERLRSLTRRILPEFREGIEFGMPYYRRDPNTAVGFASQRRHVALYFGEPILAAYRERLKGLDAGKGCIRIQNPGEIDYDLVESLLRVVARSDGQKIPSAR